MKIKIAVVQLEIVQLKPEKNLKRIETFIKKAKTKKAQVIVFPEDCITGAIEDEVTGVKGDYKKWLDKSQTIKKAFQKLAKKYQIDIVSGSCTELVKKHIFNTSYYINAKGKILGTYHKNNLYKSERPFITPGKAVCVFKTAWGKAGIVICWDIMFPEIFQKLVRAGVRLIYCPSYWFRGISEETDKYNHREQEQQIDALCIARALETESVFVYTNAAGTAYYQNGTKDILIGHSQITMPILEVVKKIKNNRENMFVQEIDLALLDKAEKVYQTRVSL